MDEFKVIEIKKSVFENNDKEADRLRAELKKEKTFLLNLMSSPGSGKTTLLKATIARLKDEMKIGVMEAAKDMGVEVVYQPIYVKDIFSYDSLFISSTSMKAMPIRSIDGRPVSRSMNTMVLRFSDYVGAWE